MSGFGTSVVAIKTVGLVLGVCLSLTMVATSAECKDKLTESGEYKGKNFRKGCIQDYNEMMEGDDIKWVWVAPDIKLADYKVQVASFEDFSDEIRKSQLEGIKKTFQEILEKNRGSKGSLNADVCIYEVQKFSAGKAWIPFAGGHQMQAGVGAEMILKNTDGKVVAKFRHFAREGAQIEMAAEEVADDLKKYMVKH